MSKALVLAVLCILAPAANALALCVDLQHDLAAPAAAAVLQPERAIFQPAGVVVNVLDPGRVILVF